MSAHQHPLSRRPVAGFPSRMMPGLSDFPVTWLRPEEGWPGGELREDLICIFLHYWHSISFILICWIREKFWHRGKIEFGPKTNHNHLPPVINNLTAHIPFAYGRVSWPWACTKANRCPWWVVLTWWRKTDLEVRWECPSATSAPTWRTGTQVDTRGSVHKLRGVWPRRAHTNVGHRERCSRHGTRACQPTRRGISKGTWRRVPARSGERARENTHITT